MKKFIYSASVEIVAETCEDAYIELLCKMDDHNIDWGDPEEEEIE